MAAGVIKLAGTVHSRDGDLSSCLVAFCLCEYVNEEEEVRSRTRFITRSTFHHHSLVNGNKKHLAGETRSRRKNLKPPEPNGDRRDSSQLVFG
ncbi:hypothetical protein HanHA300_Chr00c0134g0716081 [Helianthus annuus]|nr:hypothetical protein HanHA89_Chr02g0047751 [Helianthus annuus]KAJ0638355.1 hypothetical protein HanHA300_Chr00c0134g0716081 [Helianthus annuus]